MKDNILLSLLFFTLMSADAQADTRCMTKQKNVAAMTLANEIYVPVQTTTLVAFDYGAWTERIWGNTGSDFVTVEVPNLVDRAITQKTFQVYAKQIADTDDCNILSVAEYDPNDQ